MWYCSVSIQPHGYIGYMRGFVQVRRKDMERMIEKGIKSVWIVRPMKHCKLGKVKICQVGVFTALN